ncbi:MAG TPA: sugar phosphate isomerase/epimerase family protein [Mycobacterium sp.]|nr:sugar phosphate isomerase/epimerase family protein [Mycobacterium sp.]
MSGASAERLSINQISVRSLPFDRAVDTLARAGVGWIGAWTGSVEKCGVARSAKLLADAGVRVSSVCRAGFFTGKNPDGGGLDRDANKRAVDLTAELGAETLYLVAGGVRDDNDVIASRQAVVDGIAELLPYASAAGVKLSVEPLHPSMCADRSVVVTLNQAIDIAEQFDATNVGVAVDTYNVWWDPTLSDAITRAGNRIFSYQVCDWLVPQPHPVFGRGIPGDGVIDISAITAQVDGTGYRGPIEVEIFNERIWATEAALVVEMIASRFAGSVLAYA